MATSKLSIADFSAKIKAKYPDYANIDDNELAQRVIAKHPDYAPMVNMTSKESVKTTFGGEASSWLPSGPLGDAVKAAPGFAGNVVKSTGRLIGDVASAVVHPINTIEGLGKLAAGTIEEMTSKVFPDVPDNYRGTFNAFIKSYADRYGGWDKLRNELYKNPAGVAADIATAAAGAGLVFKGISAGGKIAGLGELSRGAERLSNAAMTVSDMTDPMANISKGIRAATSKLPSLRGRFRNPNKIEQNAAEWAMANDIPIDAGAATGNPAIKGMQYLADRSIGGSLISPAEKQKALNALANKGTQLSEQVHSSPIAAEQAGNAIRSKTNANIISLSNQAKKAYSDLDAIEKNPNHLQSIQVGTKQVNTGVLDASGNPVINTVPITKDIALPIDLRSIKTELKPIYDEMLKTMPEAQKQASPGLVAIKNILESDDYVSAATAERNLGALKKNAGYNMQQGTRNMSQGISSKAVSALQDQIDSTVTQAGPDAIAALQKGRNLTKQKWDAIAISKALRKEPVQAFNQATWAGDSGIDYLRKLNAQAPGEMAKVGRAYLDKLMDTTTKEGGFGKTGTIATSWQKLGGQTKKILFKDPELVKDLDNFFTTAKMMGENVNPSGSGYVLSLAGQGAGLIYNPLTQVPMQIGAAAMSKLMHSRAGVKLLTEGMKAPTGNIGKSRFIFNKLAYISRNIDSESSNPAPKQ